MKQSVGFTVTINIVIIFLLLTFAFIFAIIGYSKAFRANSKIVNSLEKYEGYNTLSLEEINHNMGTLGYLIRIDGKSSCKTTRNISGKVQNLVSMKKGELYDYCVYETPKDGDSEHFSYTVVTYITIDISFLGTTFKVPIYGKTRRIYYFSK